jgi:ADP-heptose:LPS heptosyltransferase
MVDAKFLRYRKDSAARRRFVRSKKVTDRLRLHVAEKYAEPLIKLGMKPRTLEQLRPVLHAEADAQGRHIVLNPFASKATKQWDKFPELASELVKLGFKVTVIGIGEFSEIDGVKNLTGATSLKEMFEVIASAETLITTDSGPMHAGVALGVKTVAVFGSTTKEFGFAPVFEGCSVAEVHGLPCRPCHVHGLPACPQGHFKCMKDISVEDVLRVVSGGF